MLQPTPLLPRRLLASGRRDQPFIKVNCSAVPDTLFESELFGQERGAFKGGHTPGDLMVWLPQQRVVFSGDIVYVDRMLGVLPFSHAGRWLESFAALEALKPAHIVSGHGDGCELPQAQAQAQAQTRDYLQALCTHMKKAVDEGTDISAAIKSFDATPWMGLLNAAELHPGNASRTYLELELELE